MNRPRTFTALQLPEKTWKRAFLLLIVGLAGMAAGALLLASFVAGEIYDYQDTVDGVHLPPVDAIVVLAGGRGRISTAGDLWFRYWEAVHRPSVPGLSNPGKVPILYVSGMGHQANWNVFARQVRRGVLEVIRPADVVLERESANTVENAIWFAQYARRQQWHRVILVTSSYHMMRSRFVLDQILHATSTSVEIETLSVFQDPYEPSEWRSSFSSYRITVSEYLKGIYFHYFWQPQSHAM